MRALLLGTAALLVVACRNTGSSQQAASPAPASDAPQPRAVQAATPAPSPQATLPVDLQMRNVRFRLDAQLTLHVRHLRGRLVGLKPGTPPVFDDLASYALEVSTGEVALNSAGLERLMNTYAFRGRQGPIRDIAVTLENGFLKLKGKLHKGIDIPFSMEATVSAAPDGTLRIHGTKRKAAGVPAGGLLDFFGIGLDDLVPAKEAVGLRVEHDDIYVDPGRLLPPPRVRGHLRDARIEGAQLVQVFGSSEPARPLSPPRPRANYLYFRHGLLRFGKLTMSDADLELVDADPRDPFDFFAARYQGQLVAGYSKRYGIPCS
jgi:hypothetical protein